MRNGILLSLLLFLSTGLLPAQAAKPSPDNKQDGKQAENLPWDMSSLNGCLQTSMGRYMLTDEDGTSHELVGSGGKLKHQVGHEIEVIGKPTTRSVDTTTPGGASSAVEHEVFEVKSVKQIATKCKSGS